MIDKKFKPCEGKKDVEDNFNTVVELLEGQKEFETDLDINRFITIAGTTTYGARDAAQPISYDACQLAYDKPLVLPCGKNDSWIVQYDYYPTSTNKLGGLPLGNVAKGLIFAFANANNVFSGEYLPVRSNKTNSFSNFIFPRDNFTGEAKVWNRRLIWQLKYENGNFYSRFGSLPTGFDGANTTEGKITWAYDWTDIGVYNNGGNAERIFTPSNEEEKRQIQQTFRDFIRYMFAGDEIVFDGIGDTSMATAYNITGSINSIKAKINTKGDWDGKPNTSMREKNIHILGSSIFYGNSGYGLAEHLYYLWRNPNIQKQAVSGTTIAVRSGYTNSYCERYEGFADKDKADVLVVQLSTNDWTLNVPDGTLSEYSTDAIIADPTLVDNTTKIGAIEYIIAKAKSNNPNVKVIFAACPILSTWTNFTPYGTFVNGVLKQIAQKWGIKICDMYNATYDSYYKTHIHPERYIPACWSKTETANVNLFRDDIHPNVDGYARVFVPAVASDIVEVLTEEN